MLDATESETSKRPRFVSGDPSFSCLNAELELRLLPETEGEDMVLDVGRMVNLNEYSSSNYLCLKTSQFGVAY